MKQEAATLEFIEYRAYPLGENFDFVDLPYRKYTVKAQDGRLFVSCTLIVEKPTFTAGQRAAIRSLYQEATRTEPKSEAIGMLVVLAAMSGDKDFEALLPDAPDELRLDGSYSEDFHSVMDDLAEVRSGRCALDEDSLPWLSDQPLHATPDGARERHP